jgi:hypothetical protein
VHVRVCGGVAQQWAALPGTIAGEMPHANSTTIFNILSFEQLLGYEPSVFSRAKLAYI